MFIVSCLAVLLTAKTAPIPAAPVSASSVTYAWHDEMENLSWWRLPGSQNDPVISVEKYGTLTMTMPQVPTGYPYTYQWGALSRTFAVNTDAGPLLVASVSRMSEGGYAHLDVEMRDYNGNVVKSVRSNTLREKGFAVVNLRDSFGSGLLRITVRLIIGGPNSGAWCDYDYLRAMRPEQLTALQDTLTTFPSKVIARAN